jgi:hypothetical protein
VIRELCAVCDVISTQNPAKRQSARSLSNHIYTTAAHNIELEYASCSLVLKVCAQRSSTTSCCCCNCCLKRLHTGSYYYYNHKYHAAARLQLLLLLLTAALLLHHCMHALLTMVPRLLHLVPYTCCCATALCPLHASCVVVPQNYNVITDKIYTG